MRAAAGSEETRRAPHPLAESRACPCTLSRTTRWLHGIVALAVLGMLASGYALATLPSGPDKSALVQLHKSFGMLVLAVALARLLWRIREGLPPALPSHRPLERLAAAGLHAVLIAATLAMPLSGIGRSLAYARPVAVFGWPVIPQIITRKHEAWSAAFSSLHDGLALVLAAAIGVHVLAALKHHLVDRDETLRRIVGLSSRPWRGR